MDKKNQLKTKLERLAKYCTPRLGKKARIGVSFKDLHTGRGFGVNAGRIGWAASLIKLPVAVGLLRQIERGKIHLDDMLSVNHDFALEPDDNVTMMPKGQKLSVLALLGYMIIRSDNEATNMLADRIGIKKINSTMDELGLHNTKMSHLLYSGAPIVYEGADGAHSNTTTANEMTKLISAVYQQKVLSIGSSNLLQKILEHDSPSLPNVNVYMQACLPPTTVIGRKCGMLEGDAHEVGVINRDYALGIMINNFNPRNYLTAVSIIGIISEYVYCGYYGLHSDFPI